MVAVTRNRDSTPKEVRGSQVGAKEENDICFVLALSTMSLLRTGREIVTLSKLLIVRRRERTGEVVIG